MDLIPINEHIEDNKEFTDNPLCQETIYMTIDFFKRVGYKKPWISYYAVENGGLVGCGAFKGAPQNGAVEIAYGTFESFRQKGIGTEICQLLVELSLKTDPSGYYHGPYTTTKKLFHKNPGKEWIYFFRYSE
jgi:RimJ/RimL family protein N-acetyltransferase